MNTTVQYDIRSDKLRREMEKVLARSPHSGVAFNFRTGVSASAKGKVAVHKGAKGGKSDPKANKG